MNNTALYIRVSTQEQVTHGYSLDEQVERLKKYCDAMSWSVSGIYTDPGFSGASTERPGLAKLIADVESGKVDKVLVYKLDRLSRSQKDTLHLIEDVFLAHGVDFVSMSENFDTATPLGRAMIGILSVFAQLEREQIKERMIMGKDARAKKGLFHGSANAPIGYDYINGQLIPNEYEAAQVVNAFEWADDGKGIYAIASIFNEAGYSTKYGRWKHMTVRRVLRNPVYIGQLRHGAELYDAPHEPLIDKALFDRVQKRMDKASDEFTRQQKRPWKAASYLGGLLVCARCGSHYVRTVYKQQRKNGEIVEYSYYSCVSRRAPNSHGAKANHCDNKNWRTEDLDNLIFAEIKKLTLKPIAIPEKSELEIEKKRKAIKENIRKLDDKISKLIDLYAVGGIPIDGVQKRIAELNGQKERLTEELNEKESMTPQEAREIALTFDDVFRQADFDEIRSLLALLIEKIELDGENIKIFWSFC